MSELAEWVNELNEQIGRDKFGWIRNSDTLHAWVITDSVCSALRSMISWWIKIFLSLYITFKTNVGWVLSLCHVCLSHFHLLTHPSKMKILIYSAYSFLLRPPFCQPTSLLIHHIFFCKRKLKHTGVDITSSFKRWTIFTNKT